MKRWEDRELDLGGMTDEVKRLLARAKRRWFHVILFTAVLTGLLVVRELRKQRFYESTVVLTATEGDQTDDAVAHTTIRLQDHVDRAVFTDRALTELMVKYDFRPDLQQQNPRFALELFRDLINVEIYKNEFTLPRYPESPPRSARIGISARFEDPDQALALTRDLGDLVVQRDADIRRERFEAHLRVANDMVTLTRADVDRLVGEVEYALAAEETVPDRRAEFKVKADGAARSLVAAQARLAEAEEKKNKLQRSKNADSQSLELRYERADWGAPERRDNRTWLLIRTILFGFFGLFPIVALTVGAFDPRIYDEKDVSRLGLKSLGRVRAARPVNS